MPSLPAIGDYEQHVDLSEPYRKITPQASPGNLGATIENVGHQWAQAADIKNRADGAVYAANQMATLRTNMDAFADDAQQKASPDGGGYTQTVLDEYDKNSKATLDASATNRYAQKALQMHLAAYRSEVASKAMAFEATAGVQYRGNSVLQNIDKLAPVVEADPSQWKQAGAEQMLAINSSNLPPQTRLLLGRKLDETLSVAAANGLARQNPQSVLDGLNDPSKAHPAIANLSDAQREQLRAKANGQLAQNLGDPIIDMYRNQGPVAGAAALKAIDTSGQPDDVKAHIYQHVEQGVAQWHQEARQESQQDIIGLEERLGNGKATLDDRHLTMALWRSGALDASQAGQTLGRIDKAQEKKVDDDAMFKYGRDSYARAQALDPKDEHIRKAMDAVFTVATNHVQPGSAEWINRAADIGQKTGVTPDSAIQWARTSLIGGNAESAASAANAIQRMTDANPRGTPFALDERTKTMAKVINDAVHAGTPEQVAVENARNVTALPDADRKRLDEIYKQKQLSQKSAGDLTSQLKDPDNGFRAHFWNGIPDVPPQMTGQFEQLRQTYFKLTGGNVDQANKLATQDLKNTWGITQVNGKKEFMQFAPEAMNPGLTTAGVQADMQASAKGLTDDPSKVRLIATADTFQSNGQRWAIGVPDKFGAYSALTDAKGRVIPYQLPTGTAALKASIQKASEEGMAKLHEQQTIEHAREKNELGEIQMQGRQMGNF